MDEEISIGSRDLEGGCEERGCEEQVDVRTILFACVRVLFESKAVAARLFGPIECKRQIGSIETSSAHGLNPTSSEIAMLIPLPTFQVNTYSQSESTFRTQPASQINRGEIRFSDLLDDGLVVRSKI